MQSSLLNLYRSRYLVRMWILRDIKVRYKQSLVGTAWAVLQPLSLMLIFTVVFSLFIKVPADGAPYPLFAYTAVLPWTFFATSISTGALSLVQNMSLLTKIYFPREVPAIAAVGAALVDYACGFVIFILLLLVYRIPLSWSLFWIPLILIVQIALSLGIGLFAATATVFYRDVRFVVPLLLQLWMYASPVIYSTSTVPERLRLIYFLNPMAGVIESYRLVALFGRSPDILHLALGGVVALAVLVAAYAHFCRVQWQFADIV